MKRFTHDIFNINIENDTFFCLKHLFTFDVMYNEIILFFQRIFLFQKNFLFQRIVQRFFKLKTLKIIKKTSLLCVLFLFNGVIGSQAKASPLENIYIPHDIQNETNTISCWDKAALYQKIDPWLLYSVGYTESSLHPQTISKPNRNGTYDIGLMQINSTWLPELQRYGITQNHLMDGCVSIYVGAWILSKTIKRYGYSWEAIASYNTGNVDSPQKRQLGLKYAQKVYTNYEKFKHTYRK